jgi:hypothetical protein
MPENGWWVFFGGGTSRSNHCGSSLSKEHIKQDKLRATQQIVELSFIGVGNHTLRAEVSFFPLAEAWLIF